MHKLKILWLALLAIVFLAPAQSRDVRQGVIQGFVLGAGGQPVGGAKVHAQLKGGLAMKAIRYVETDESGFFLIDRLDFGSYYIGAMKEEDGYGSIDSSFFNDKSYPNGSDFCSVQVCGCSRKSGGESRNLDRDNQRCPHGETHTGRFRLSAGERPQQVDGNFSGAKRVSIRTAELNRRVQVTATKSWGPTPTETWEERTLIHRHAHASENGRHGFQHW
jgi:hypothetical protein